MRKFYTFLFITLLIAGCTSSRKYLQRAQFDAAINKSVQKLRKNPNNEKELAVLKEAYAKANQINTDRINFLKTSGEQNVWDEIYSNFNAMKYRQDQVKTLPDAAVSRLNIVFKNYDQEIIEAKKKAAEFYYNHAMELLKRNDRMSAREAFYDLQRVKQLYSDFKDVDARMAEAQFKGTSNVLFKIKNQTNIMMPRGFEEDMLKISMNDLNTQWLNYDTYASKDLYYDYYIQLNIKGIMVSPQQLREEVFTDEKEIQDGTKYLLDSKGNVRKDTAGNDMKVPVYKIITCKVFVTHQMKTATVTATLDYINNSTGQLIRTQPLTSEWIFENHAGIAVGNQDALKPETKKYLGVKIAPFPSDPDMVMNACNHLKEMTKDFIWNNKGILN